MTRDRKMTSRDVNALRNGPKWWLYSSLAMAALVGMGLTETSAQADATATSTATATTTVQGTPGQQLQADQVTLTTAANTQAPSSEAPVGTATGGDEATDDAENAGDPSTGTGSVAQEAVDRTSDGDVSVTEDDVPTSTAPAEDQSSAAESAAPEQPGEADGTVENTTQPDPEEATTEPAAAQSPSSTTDSKSTTSDLEPAEKVKINEEKEVESPRTTANPARYRAAAAPAMLLAETVSEDLSDRFEDQNLLAAVRKGLGLKEGELLTQAFIQDYKVGIVDPTSRPVVNVVMPKDSWLTSLAGLEVLADLSSQYAVDLTVYLGETAAAMQQIDFSPLTATTLYIGNLNLYSPHWGAVSEAQMAILTQINSAKVHNMEFSAPTNSVINFNGMTNAQFAILAPFVAAVLENSYPGNHMIGFSGNNITDFSPLKTITNNSHTSQITGWYQYAQVQQAIAFKPGQTVTVTSPVTGIMGESFNYRVRYYQDDGSENGVLTVAEGQQVMVTAADGTQQLVWQYQLVNPKLINNQLVYGHFNYTDAGRTNYTVDANGQPLQEVTLAAGALVFQPVSDQGKITVHYVDDTTAETLKSDTLTGNLETVSPYRTQETLDHYLAAGYILVSDDYPVDGATFTADEQTFTVHLKHGTKTVDQAKAVTRTIHYRYADGTTAAPDHLSRVTFTQQGTQDLVTGDTVWGDWEATENPAGFPAQTSPTITGYTADRLEVAAVPDVIVTSADQTVVVTYTVNHLQNVTVTYRDATTGAVLQTETLAGDYGTTSDYRTADQIAAYLSQGYELADDDYPVDGVVFSETAQAFTVNLTHGLEALANSKRVTQTIHYRYADGTTAAPDYVAWLTFMRQGTRDKVTGQTQWQDWVTAEGTREFAAKVSPDLPGYTADRSVVAAIPNVTATDADYVTVVTYTAQAVVPPVTPPVTPPIDPDPVPNPDPEPGEQPDQGEAPAEPDGLPNDQEGVTPDTVAPKDTDFPVDVVTGGQPVILQAAQSQAVAGKRQETTTRNVAASHPQAAALTQTRATRLPQTNDQQSPWAWLGALGLSLLGWIGWRKQK